MWHELALDTKFLTLLGEVDAEYAERVHAAGCPYCGGPLDCASYARKARGELGEAAGAYERRASFCCRNEGCRRRATPPSLRFFGRKVYVAVLVVVASVAGRAEGARNGGRRVSGVPGRTVLRWLSWWQGVFALSPFWSEAKSFLATPVETATLPTSLLVRFGAGAAALEKMLRFTAPTTTTSVRARIAMVV